MLFFKVFTFCLVLVAVIRCPYIPEIENGNVSVSGRTEGSVAQFVCDAGFDMLGESRLVCENNNGEGKWTSSVPVCVKPGTVGTGLTLGYESLDFLTS